MPKTPNPHPSGSRSRLVQLAETTSNVTPEGYGDLLFPSDPAYPPELPQPGNGLGELRADMNSPLARAYRFMKIHANGEVFIVENGAHRPVTWTRELADPRVKALMEAGGGRRLIAWRLLGFSDPDADGARKAPKEIRKFLAGHPCVFDGVSSANEVDFKFGRSDQAGFPTAQDADCAGYYQPVSQHAHKVKKAACARCSQSGERPGVSHMGFPVDFTEGGACFEPSCTGCRGCYFFDPVAFRRAASQSIEDFGEEEPEIFSAA